MKVLDLVRDNIKNMKAYSSARDEFNEASKSMIFIDANENPFENGLNRYPDPQQIKVKQELSKIKNIAVNQILLGNGSDEVLDLIFRAFCEPNKDNSIALPPTYGMYEVLANLNAIELIKVNLTTDFQPKVEDILIKVNSNTKLLFLCSPNNPTANSFEAVKIEKLLKEFPGIVVIDEAYINFSAQESWLNRLNEFPNLIVTQTLSKAYGMAAIRLGICYASNEIISILNRIKPPYNINKITQQKALEGLKNNSKTEQDIAQILSQRKFLTANLEAVSWIKIVYPSDANFLLIKVDNADKRYQQLIAQGIVARNRSRQPLCDNCLRITIGTEQENEKLISILKNI